MRKTGLHGSKKRGLVGSETTAWQRRGESEDFWTAACVEQLEQLEHSTMWEEVTMKPCNSGRALAVP